MLDRTLRQIIDSISEKAKEEGVPPPISGALLFDVMALRNLHDSLYYSSVAHHELLGHPPERKQSEG